MTSGYATYVAVCEKRILIALCALLSKRQKPKNARFYFHLPLAHCYSQRGNAGSGYHNMIPALGALSSSALGSPTRDRCMYLDPFHRRDDEVLQYLAWEISNLDHWLQKAEIDMCTLLCHISRFRLNQEWLQSKALCSINALGALEDSRLFACVKQTKAQHPKSLTARRSTLARPKNCLAYVRPIMLQTENVHNHWSVPPAWPLLSQTS